MTISGGDLQSKGQHTSWRLVDGLLHVQLPNGSILIPSADQIYQAVFEGNPFSDLPNPITVSDGEISFSRYPLTLEIRIEANGNKSESSLRVTVYAKGQGVLVPIENIKEPKADHIVANNCWYPLAFDMLDEVRTIFDAASICCPGKISLKQYLKLVQLSANHLIILNVSGDASSAARLRASEVLSVPTGFIGNLYPGSPPIPRTHPSSP